MGEMLPLAIESSADLIPATGKGNYKNTTYQSEVFQNATRAPYVGDTEARFFSQTGPDSLFHAVGNTSGGFSQITLDEWNGDPDYEWLETDPLYPGVSPSLDTSIEASIDRVNTSASAHMYFNLMHIDGSQMDFGSGRPYAVGVPYVQWGMPLELYQDPTLHPDRLPWSLEVWAVSRERWEYTDLYGNGYDPIYDAVVLKDDVPRLSRADITSTAFARNLAEIEGFTLLDRITFPGENAFWKRIYDRPDAGSSGGFYYVPTTSRQTAYRLGWSKGTLNVPLSKTEPTVWLEIVTHSAGPVPVDDYLSQDGGNFTYREAWCDYAIAGVPGGWRINSL